MDLSTISFAAPTPYPSLDAVKPNRQYASAILSNIGSCNSEMTAISLYLYNSTLTRAVDDTISQCFFRINLVEMRHMQLFSETAYRLGADPRLWSPDKGRMQYWSPACNNYPTILGPMIRNAIAGEEGAIRQYRHQADMIEDQAVCAVLNRITEDEVIHLSILQRLLDEISLPNQAGPAIPQDPCLP